jgi:hypothetical protein
MSDTALHFDTRVDGLQGLDQTGVAVGNDKFQVFTFMVKIIGDVKEKIRN